MEKEQLTIEITDDIDSVREQWIALYRTIEQPSVYSSYEYAKLWYQHFSIRSYIIIITAYVDDHLVGVLPLVKHQRGLLRLIKSLTNDYSMISEPLVVDRYQRLFIAAVYDWLSQHKLQWDYLQYDGTYSFSKYFELLSENKNFAGNMTCEYVKYPTYVAHIENSFDMYIRNNLSKNAKQNYQKAINKLERAKSWEFMALSDKMASSRWDTFLRLEDAGWKGEGKSSIAKLSTNHRDYYQGLITLLEVKQALRMYFLTIEGEYVAGVFGVADNEVFHYAKAGYDPRFKQYSPSNLLLMLLIRELCVNSPVTKIFHMYPGDYGYKHRFCPEKEECLSLRIYNNTLRGRGFRFMRQAKKFIKPGATG